ncbi:CheR family methyltransferase [Maridesulfovibrio sp. FT414]|uniref:CheR family methyltransferase n=1 Tax=Maridesulfovibrio sp. FT414 TaxID=2979469 RepID=UPI003D8003BF
MNLEPFNKILNKAMGLSADSLSRSGIVHAIKARMRQTGCDEYSYLNLLRSSEEECSELIENIVVPETWFFRDVKPFELLFETAFKHRQGEFRVLSAPCSTGEEPYSIAMTLMGAGFDPSRFRVDGVDISNRAIEKARCGIYTENSFRGSIPSYAENCFRKCDQGRKLAEKVKDSVSFYTGNIVEGCLPSGKYDVIFCRNLLIYLDDRSKRCLAEALSEKLKDTGLLFVGHAELLPVFNDWFTPVRKKGTFALRKGPFKVAPLLKNPECPRECRPKKVVPLKRILKPGPVPEEDPVQPETHSFASAAPAAEAQRGHDSKTSLPGIAKIRKIADQGRTAEALALCAEVLGQSGPEPDLYHLCGLLHEAEGNTSKAEEFYGKALYLEPQHLESLVHLALLLENRGETRRAGLLRNRLRRAENR